MLRVYSVGGLQLQLLRLSGPVVGMAVHEKEMMVVYHKATGNIMTVEIIFFSIYLGSEISYCRRKIKDI